MKIGFGHRSDRLSVFLAKKLFFCGKWGRQANNIDNDR